MTYDEAFELAEIEADKKGIYGVASDDYNEGKNIIHPSNCKCRICFVLNKTEELMNEQNEQPGLF